MIGRSPRARLLALAASAVALAGTGAAIERAGLFAQLRFAVQQAGTELPSTLAVDRSEVVRGLPILSLYLDPAELGELLDHKLEHGLPWERRAAVSYFESGELRFAGTAGVRVHGGGSRLNSPHQSFRLFFRRRYGFTRLGTSVLFDEASQPLQRLVVHNDVRTDTDGTEWRLVNPLAYDLSRRMGCITPEAEPARFILNGDDLGLYVLTEHFDNEYFASHMPGRPIAMDAADMEALRDRLDAMRPLTMARVAEVIDVENLVNWFLSVLFSATRDAYQGPGQFLDEARGRWFWINWDMDQSFRSWDMDSFQYLLPFPGERGRGRRGSEPRPYVLGTLISEDASFREYLAARIDAMLNHQLTPDFLRERRNHYYEVALRFGVEKLEYQRRLDQFLDRRRAFVRATAEQWLNTAPSVPVSIRRLDAGSLQVDGFDKPGRYEGSYFPQREVVVRASGGTPVRWTVNGGVRSEGVELRVTADRPLVIVAQPPGSDRVTAPSPSAIAPAPPMAARTPVRPATPVRWRVVTRAPGGESFEMAETETTVAQYREFAESNGRMLPRQPLWSGDDHPVVNLTWAEAGAYCAWAGGRLPTEAEWELAARAGSSARYPWGRAFDPDRANGTRQAGRDRFPQTAPVASFPPNAFGLYDMVGNVWEWTSDWHRRGARDGAPPGPDSADFLKTVRGGSWINRPENLRLDRRLGLSPAGRHNLYVGIRCVR